MTLSVMRFSLAQTTVADVRDHTKFIPNTFGLALVEDRLIRLRQQQSQLLGLDEDRQPQPARPPAPHSTV